MNPWIALIAALTAPGAVSYIGARLWIALGNPLQAHLAPSSVPLELALWVTGWWWALAGGGLVAYCLAVELRTGLWPSPHD